MYRNDESFSGALDPLIYQMEQSDWSKFAASFFLADYGISTVGRKGSWCEYLLMLKTRLD
jgi:hypothetical protein